ncbi:biotin/lipoyl-containing protein [Henriciella litoralis]|uniref:biotin/lipoyl-containing protein n=1 Tax=Henriciella litoralis TaxID=568102 RepID=UPI000A036469|nr:biotin/lipoyl-containing protein [Henriciella litoralis]
MKTEIRIPGLGAGMAEGTITDWHVDNGGKIEQGDLLYTLESEKTAQDVESPVTGVVQRIGTEGETYPVGEIIAIIEH